MARGYVLHLYGGDNAPLGERRFGALPIRIGRNSLNDCCIGQNFISDFHARLEETDGRLCIRDLNSKNGVFIRSNPGMTPVRIAPNAPAGLAPELFEFFLGPFIRVEVRFYEADTGIERDPKSTGAVLGNRQMLGAGLPSFSARSGPPDPWAMNQGGQTAPRNAGPGALPELPGVAPLPSLDGSGWSGGNQRAPSGVPPPYGAQPSQPLGYGPDPYGPQARANSPSMQPGPVDLKKTGHFGMSTELLALMGLRELAGSLLPGTPLETTGDVARLITKLHDAIEVFCRCFIPLRDGYAQFVSSMDLQRAAMMRSVNRSRSYASVELAKDPAAVAAALLDWRDQSMDAPRAIEGIFADLMVHQVALLDGVMQGVRALLEELSPASIQKSLENREPRSPLGINLGGKHKALWEAFCERYEQLSDEQQAFSTIFGAEFTEAYREYRRRRSDGSRSP